MKIEALCLEIISLAITAAFESKNQKLESLYSARIKIELLKRLFRLTYELKIIGAGFYLDFEFDLQEMSKMVNGWIKYLS